MKKTWLDAVRENLANVGYPIGAIASIASGNMSECLLFLIALSVYKIEVNTRKKKGCPDCGGDGHKSNEYGVIVECRRCEGKGDI